MPSQCRSKQQLAVQVETARCSVVAVACCRQATHVDLCWSRKYVYALHAHMHRIANALTNATLVLPTPAPGKPIFRIPKINRTLANSPRQKTRKTLRGKLRHVGERHGGNEMRIERGKIYTLACKISRELTANVDFPRPGNVFALALYPSIHHPELLSKSEEKDPGTPQRLLHESVGERKYNR